MFYILKYYSHSAARSHPRLAFGYQSKGDQPAPGCQLGVEEPKDGEIKEKVKRDQARSSSQTIRYQCIRGLG
jgi:hypothetical protein